MFLNPTYSAIYWLNLKRPNIERLNHEYCTTQCWKDWTLNLNLEQANLEKLLTLFSDITRDKGRGGGG